MSCIIMLILLLSTLFFHCSVADFGTAARYNPLFLPTACFGGDTSRFPLSNMVGAAGEEVWDNGAACGRQYQVRCISTTDPTPCISGQSIEIMIVDRALSSLSRPSLPTTSIVLSTTAYNAIANASASFITVQYNLLKEKKTTEVISGSLKLVVKIVLSALASITFTWVCYCCTKKARGGSN